MCWSLFSTKSQAYRAVARTYPLHAPLRFYSSVKIHQLSINYVLNNVKFKVMFTKAYLEPSWTSMISFFAKIVYDLQLLTIFAKSSLIDVWLDKSCEMVPLNSFILQYLCHNQFVFCFRKWKHYVEKHLVANFTRFPLINKHHLRRTTSKSKVTKNIFHG